MFIQPRDTGWVELIIGPMFSGKTEELIRRLRRAAIAKQSVRVFKPVIDTRYSDAHVVSHSDQRLTAVAVSSAEQILDLLEPDVEVVGIDEAQFLGDSVVQVVEQLADQGKRVVVAGLDSDFRAQPFEPIPRLVCLAEYVTKLLAICARCGNPAARNQRLSGGTERIELGASERYEARCRACFDPPR